MTPNKPYVRAVLFDLDGTLADTAADMADALNILLDSHDRPFIDYETARKHTSRGSVALIGLGYDHPLNEELREQLKKEYLQIYAENLCIKTKLFPGVEELLKALDEYRIPWGIVTNKPGHLTKPLLKKLGIAQRAACIVSGDSVANNKPHPEPLHYAAKILAIEEKSTIYMGDDFNDARAGQAAGMLTAVAAYGYILDDQDPHSWSADVVVQQALDLKDWLFENNDSTISGRSV